MKNGLHAIDSDLHVIETEDVWSMTFYTSSHEPYQLYVFNSGSSHGTPKEEAFDIAAVYLQD